MRPRTNRHLKSFPSKKRQRAHMPGALSGGCEHLKIFSVCRAHCFRVGASVILGRVMTMTPVDKVLARLPGAKPVSGGYQARCPAHDDKSPSLRIREADDGRALVHLWGVLWFTD
jgi:hypothetical protein